MKEIFRAIDNAYSALDDCISKIVKSRLYKDRESEERALYKLEIETNGVLQDLSYIKRQLQKRDWIKVEDRLPEYAALVLVAWRNPDIVGMGYCYGEDNWRSDDGEYSEMATPHYWMPIVPPKED
jgi:hypothetical protein